MQNKYIGDIGDFSKYLLLQYLCVNQELSLGINWFFNEFDNNDYSKIKIPDDYSNIDKLLFDNLKDCKSVEDIKKSAIFPESTLYYSEQIKIEIKRLNWFRDSLDKLKNQDVLFFDPDNGLEVSSCGKLSKGAVKYVFFDEIIEAFSKEKTIVIYQHINHNHSFEEHVKLRIEQLEISLGIAKESIKAISFKNDKRRFYLTIVNDKHKNNVSKLLKMSSNFNEIRI